MAMQDGVVMTRRYRQEDAATRALKRVRQEKSYISRKKRNEEQATFKEKVEDAIITSLVELEIATRAI